MSFKEEKLIVSRDKRVVYPANGQDDAFFDGERIPRISGGRINGVLRVDQSDDKPGTEIQLRDLFFYGMKLCPLFFCSRWVKVNMPERSCG